MSADARAESPPKSLDPGSWAGGPRRDLGGVGLAGTWP